MIQDVLVKVDRCYYPINFIVLDIEPIFDTIKHILVILGCPFLAIANAVINCHTGVMDITFGNITVHLNVFNTANQPHHDDSLKCYSLTSSDEWLT